MQPDPIYKALGATIRARRKQFRLTQQKLAPQLGMSRASLANVETGRQTVLVHQLYRFAEVLEMSPADLLPPPPADGSRRGLPELPLPDDLKPQQRKQIARLLE